MRAQRGSDDGMPAEVKMRPPTSSLMPGQLWLSLFSLMPLRPPKSRYLGNLIFQPSTRNGAGSFGCGAAKAGSGSPRRRVLLVPPVRGLTADTLVSDTQGGRARALPLGVAERLSRGGPG